MKEPRRASKNYCPNSYYKNDLHNWSNTVCHNNFFPNHESEVCILCGMLRVNLAYDSRGSASKRPPAGVRPYSDRWAYFAPLEVDPA